MTRGLLFNVQRFSLHDGPGIRTTFFLKGCPLSCSWCHNPEGMTTAPEIVVTPDRCIGCKACVEACPLGLPSGVAGGWAGSRDLCEACGRCAEACPTQARSVAGQEMTVAQALEEGLRDRVFYASSGGGVTFSGGEPLRQASFVLESLAAFRDHAVHTAVDTCGLVEPDDLLAAAELADLFLYDIKHMDDELHREWAGASNSRILSNLEALSRAHEAIWVRMPLIPGVNDGRRNLQRTARLIARLPGVRRVGLLPYHRLGTDKRARIGTDAAAPGIEVPAPELMRDAAAVFEAAGLRTTIGG